MSDVFFNPLVWGEEVAEKKNRSTAKSLGEVYEKFIYRHVTESYNTDLGQKNPIRVPDNERTFVYDKPQGNVQVTIEPPKPTMINCRFHMWQPDLHKCSICGVSQVQYLNEQRNAQ